MKSQSDGVSKTDGERYPMRAFQPGMSCYSSILMFFSEPSQKFFLRPAVGSVFYPKRGGYGKRIMWPF
jgi:hypothetical protein